MIWSELLCRASRALTHPAVRTDNEILTYADLIDRAETIALRLPRRPSGRTARALLLETDPLGLLLDILGCWRAGFVPVIAREGRDAAGIAELARFLLPDVVLGPAERTDWLIEQEPHPKREHFGARDEALAVCTSGTTAVPKLVALPAESLLINLKTIAHDLELQPDDLVAVYTPLTYMYGLAGCALAALWAGATVRLFASGIPVTQFQAAIRGEGVTVFQGPPSFVRLFMAYWNGVPFSSVRLVTTGGEHLDGNLVARIENAFPSSRRVFLYGMTEAGPRISHSDFGAGPVADGYVGQPFAHIDWKVEPISTDFPGNAGRLCLRGPSMFLGYLAGPEGYTGLEADGYFRSNDVVQVNRDGSLKFLDRADRLFKCGGKLVSPSDVETILARHPAVEDVRCKKQKHAILGFVPVADIVLRRDMTPTVSELSKHCARSLQRHAIPREFRFTHHFALGSSGKRAGHQED